MCSTFDYYRSVYGQRPWVNKRRYFKVEGIQQNRLLMKYSATPDGNYLSNYFVRMKNFNIKYF